VPKVGSELKYLEFGEGQDLEGFLIKSLLV